MSSAASSPSAARVVVVGPSGPKSHKLVTSVKVYSNNAANVVKATKDGLIDDTAKVSLDASHT